MLTQLSLWILNEVYIAFLEIKKEKKRKVYLSPNLAYIPKPNFLLGE